MNRVFAGYCLAVLTRRGYCDENTHLSFPRKREPTWRFWTPAPRFHGDKLRGSADEQGHVYCDAAWCISLFCCSAWNTPADPQHVRVPRYLPLLPARVGVPHYSIQVYDEKPRTLAQGEDLTLHLVRIVYFMGRVNQERDWKGMPSKVSQRVLHRIIDYNEDFGACPREFRVLVRQMAEVPVAEGSLKAPQEDQHHASFPPVIAKGNARSVHGRKCEVRRHRTNGHWIVRDWHDSPLSSNFALSYESPRQGAATPDASPAQAPRPSPNPRPPRRGIRARSGRRRGGRQRR